MLNAQMSLGEAFHQVAEAHRDQEAMVCGETRLTYGQLVNCVHTLARRLAETGLHKGDRVAALLYPGPDYAILFFAVAEIGAVFVPLNPQYRLQSLWQILENASPAIMVTEQPPGEDLSSRLASLRVGVVTQGMNAPYPSLRELMTAQQPIEWTPPSISPSDILALLYTSGTTGAPKGILHSHRSLITPVLASIKIRELWLRRPGLKMVGQTAKALLRYKARLLQAAGRQQTFLSTIGWHTISGIELMLQGLLMGDKLVVMRRFHPRSALELIERERVTVLVAVPTALQAVLNVTGMEKYNTSSLLICGTGSMPCPPTLARQIQERLGCAVHIGFGATETGGGIAVTSISDTDQQQATTVGRPLPGMQIKIVDDQRKELPAGQVGELAIRSDSVMLGYYQASEATSKVLDADGWYYTGDLARMDEQGYLRIVGRKTDMIVRGGQNIYPTEIETYLALHPKIQEAAILGIPSVVGGEEVWAFILLKNGEQMDVDEVLNYCREKLETYQIPSQVRFVSNFPRTETGKIQKYILREEILRQMGNNHHER